MGWLSGLVDSFTGKSARDDIDKGIGAVNANTDKAVGAYQQAGTEAKGYLAPFRDRGGRAMYDASLGLNGAGARDQAQDTYLSDPILAKLRLQREKERGWAFNARQGYGVGAHALADSRANLEGYGSWQNRLGQVGQEEQAASTTSAGIAQQAGAGAAGAYGAGSGALAGLYGERAKTENAGLQNAIGVGGTVAKFLPWNWGNNLSQKTG